ncbi:MAG: aquaporin, partial [Methanocellales archaeon]|nr:aquaporin [Methanocellales archaeon]
MNEEGNRSTVPANQNNGYPLYSKLTCEFLGSMFLVMAAISPIILFRHRLETSIAIAVLADALAVGFILFALIEVFGPISGGHFNPAVSIAMALSKKMEWNLMAIYIIVQMAGGILGMLFSHLMFYHEISK